MAEFACSRGGKPPGDADRAVIARYREYLTRSGLPCPHLATEPERAAWWASLTPEQRTFRRLCLTDPGWRDFLGLPPLAPPPPTP